MRSARRWWERFWMRFAGLGLGGRFAARMAGLFAPPYLAGTYLARLGGRSYVHPTADICHAGLEMGPNSYIGERVVVYRAAEGGTIHLGQGSHLMRETIVETGQGGSIEIGSGSFVHARCQLMAYKGKLTIGSNCTVAAGCAFYAYNHSYEPGHLIKRQPIRSAGGIRIEDGVWLGFGVVVLDGAEIGEGAVIGAGSVVAGSIPANAIAIGNPARVARFR